MPAVSEKQRKAMAIAKNAPGKLFARNKSMKKMSKKQLGDFAKKSRTKKSVASKMAMMEAKRKAA